MGKIRTIALAATLAATLAAAFAAAIGWCGTSAQAAPAGAHACPGHPDALGTSRTLAISFDQYQQLGAMQYKQALPLADHEVVLTFDDGPMRLLSEKALAILNAQCVKVNYFIIGEMAHYFPDIVRREYASGDTIGTHSQDHPLRFDRISDQKVQWEIDQGIASVGAALGNPAEVAPFFRIPGLGRTKVVDSELAKRRLIVFSADVVADDWFRHITPDQIIARAMRRLERRGRGILLLHDIHPATVLALPRLLKALKDNGFHVVHVVPAEQATAKGPSAPAAPAAPSAVAAVGGASASSVAAAPENPIKPAAAPVWPQVEPGVPTDHVALAAPGIAAFDVNYRVESDNATVGNTDSQWPSVSGAAIPSPNAQLPVPGLADIGASLQGGKLVGRKLQLRRNRSRRAATMHVRARRHHPRGHRPMRARAGSVHQHAHSGRRSRTASLSQARKAAQRKSRAF
jgi:peptidoglycan-N-acetylglucosamine deacetylase